MFSNNYIITNADKCHLLTSASEEVSVKIENEIIKSSLQEKSRLTFESHVENLCKKARKKLHALARTANYVDKSKKRSIMNGVYPFAILVRTGCFAVENLTIELTKYMSAL